MPCWRIPQWSKDSIIFLHEDDLMKTTAAVRDPVCDMDIDPATAAARTVHDGETYYFCSTHCKEKFDSNPRQYTASESHSLKTEAHAAHHGDHEHGAPHESK